MTAGIRIRSYRVGFGDCFLVSVPDGAVRRHMLIDFGNAPGRGSSNQDFPAIARNIRDETDGHLDVVVMTHEHLDHMEGFRSQKKIFDAMTVDYVWMSLPSQPGYYQAYPRAEPLKRLKTLAHQYHKSLTRRKIRMAGSFETLLRNNLGNVERVDYLRKLAGKKTLYLARNNRRQRVKPFSANVKIRVLAPEADASTYYGRGGHRLAATATTLGAAVGELDGPRALTRAAVVRTPINMTDSDWQRLYESIQGGAVNAVRTLDRAQNNTSLVFLMEVAGKRLLFTGDAELESWHTMRDQAASLLAKPLDFLKVSHHGSRNGTPLAMLDTLLPRDRKNEAVVMLSTRCETYGTVNPVPDEAIQRELKARCRRLVSTDKLKPLWIDVTL